MDNLGVIAGKYTTSPVRFDWYQGTAVCDPDELRAVISDAAPYSEWKTKDRAPQGYGIAWTLEDAAGRVCDVWAGGSHQYPHFVASGPSAHVVAEVVRGQLARRHTISRADPCIDFVGPGAYDQLQDACIAIAKATRVKIETAGDHLVTFEGRTVYLGARSSHARARVYDKSAELRAKFANCPDMLEAIPAHLTRLEGQVRPKSPEAKARAATLSPLEFFGAAEWMRELMLLVGGMELSPFEAGTVWRKSDDQRAYAAMVAQYGNMLARMAEDLGSWDNVGRTIGDDLAAYRRRSQKA